MILWRLLLLLLAPAICLPQVAQAADGAPPSGAGAPAAADSVSGEPAEVVPWDFDPYRVMIWIATSAPGRVSAEWEAPVSAFLDRDFAALWRVDVVAAPPSLTALAQRDFAAVDYAALTADDPVLAMKRNHENASRIRYPADVASNLKKILVTADYADAVRRRGAAAGNADLHGMAARFTPLAGGLLDLRNSWGDSATEGILVPRGIALRLDPTPKILELKVAERMGELFSSYDKIFVVSVENSVGLTEVVVREIDAPLRLPGPVLRSSVSDPRDIPETIARNVRQAFAPVVRLEDVGTKTVEGRLRGGGLIMDPKSPAAVNVGDFLQPVLRKDDRTGEPMLLGVVDWTYLKVTDKAEARLSMDLHSGRAGALQGRRNSRTHRLALKIRPVYPETILRLHAKGAPDQPLVGYDIYEKQLESGDMKFVGHTDWDGRIAISQGADPMRLLYVKNGGAVLARLPLVPGQSRMETADLLGDDIRLRAEAYIRGVQNAIIDLVAIRTLFASAIRTHIEDGDLQKAGEMLDKLRKEPSYQKLADDMEVKAATIRSRNGTIQKKIDNMFRETRELMGKHLNRALIRDLEAEFFKAGGASLDASAATTEPVADAKPAEPEAAGQ